MKAKFNVRLEIETPDHLELSDEDGEAWTKLECEQFVLNWHAAVRSFVLDSIKNPAIEGSDDERLLEFYNEEGSLPSFDVRATITTGEGR